MGDCSKINKSKSVEIFFCVFLNKYGFSCRSVTLFLDGNRPQKNSILGNVKAQEQCDLLIKTGIGNIRVN